MKKNQPLSLILPVFLLVGGGELWFYPQIAIAQSCVADSSCPPQPIQFIPGEVITVEVINRSSSLIAIEQIQGTDAFTLDPGKTVSFFRGGTITPNFSVIIWDIQGLSLKFKLSQPQPKKLRIEVYLGDGFYDDHHAIYLRDDGRLDLF